MPAKFLNRKQAAAYFEGKSVAIVGSGPSVQTNRRGFIDKHDVVLRVNNYKLTNQTGHRTDVFYSFFGHSIKKSAEQLQHDGVQLCMCKCPNAKAIDSDWHEKTNRHHGVDFRWIYERRADWWFCDTYVPTVAQFKRGFNLLGRHVPTTGFAAILDVITFAPKSIYITGFDFFKSGIHNVDERWRRGNLNDPIRHIPEAEREWLERNRHKYPITTDSAL